MTFALTLGTAATAIYALSAQIGLLRALILTYILCGLAALCAYGAMRQHFINAGALRGTQASAASIPSVAPSKPPPPTISFITAEANVALVRSGATFRRLPGDGEVRHAAIGAFRVHGSNASLTAHVQIGESFAHSAPWVGAQGSGVFLSVAGTGELILATHGGFGSYDLNDITLSGLAKKPIPYGNHVATVEIEALHTEPKRFLFDLELTKDPTKMKVTLRHAT